MAATCVADARGRFLAGPVLLLAAASWARPAPAQSTKLNGPLAGPGSDVTEFRIDPAGTHAFYVADQDQAGVRELYRVPIDQSSAPIQLNGPLVLHGDVGTFQIGSAGRVVYRADAAFDETFELFSVPSDGSQPAVRLNPPLAADRDVTAFAISPDGTRVVYFADQDADEVIEGFTVPIDASEPAQKLHPPFAQYQFAYQCFFDPTGTQVIFPSYRYVPPLFNFVVEVFSVPADASSAPVLLASYTDQDDTQGIDQVVFSPHGELATYTRSFFNSAADFRRQLFLVPVDGSAPALQLGIPGAQYAGPGHFTSDGSRVVYGVGDDYPTSQPRFGSATLDGVSTPLDTGEAGLVGAWQLDPVGDAAFFARDSGVYRVPADASAPQTLLSPGVPNPYLYPNLALSPDGTRVVFIVQNSLGDEHLGSVPSSGGPTVTLSPPLDLHEWTLLVSPNSRFVVYAEETAPSVHEFFAVPIGGGPPHRINGPLPPGGTVRVSFARPLVSFLADGSVAYLASEDTSGVFELFKAPIKPEWNRRLPASPPGGTVSR